MQLSKLIAKITSVIYLLAASGAMLSANHYRRIADDMFSNSAVTYLAGFMAVLIGFLIVNYHNRWVGNWTVLITVIGWLALLKGVALIAFPQVVHNLSEAMFTSLGLKIYPFVAFALGVLFGYFGFVCGEASTHQSTSQALH